MSNSVALEVYAFERSVGTIARLEDSSAFQYSAEWQSSGFAISPFSLPLDNTVHVAKWRPFQGIFGVFSDSLPDGWGRLLLDRTLRYLGENPERLTEVDRLAIVGQNGMGALEYRPSKEAPTSSTWDDLDQLALECRKVFKSEYSADLDRLFHLGGSSGGARPKILVDIDEEPWIIKFHTSEEDHGAGAMEYAYAQCATACGISVSENRLLPSDECEGYFAVKRFDRFSSENGRHEKRHMLSVAGMLETSHRTPNLDYNQLMKLTWLLTKDVQQLKQLYRLMCFNVFAHNRDDHAKNFAFLHDETGVWSLSPAYDLTYSNSIGGEHATTVAGNGVNPGLSDVLKVASEAGIDSEWAEQIAHEISEIVAERLDRYLK